MSIVPDINTCSGSYGQCIASSPTDTLGEHMQECDVGHAERHVGLRDGSARPKPQRGWRR